MTTCRFGLGHLADLPDERDLRVERLLARRGPVGVPASVDLSAHVGQVRDQSITSSCVGQAFARAIHVRAGVEGKDLPFPSALAIYTLAREEERAGMLLDRGCYPRNAAKAISRRGVCGEQHWPFDADRVNGAVPWRVLQDSADALVDGYYRIGGIGADRCELVRSALAAGFPVPFATQVDHALEGYAGRGEIGAFRGPSLGGHMMCLIGYRPGAFLGVNSWGSGWGLRGLFWMTDERIGSESSTDFYALNLAPEGMY